MSVSDILAVVLLLEKLAQHKSFLLRLLSLLADVLKRLAGGVVLFFGSMWSVATPYGAWNAARETPMTSTYSLAAVIVAFIVTVLLLGIIGLLTIGFGAMYAAPNSQLGKALSLSRLQTKRDFHRYFC